MRQLSRRARGDALVEALLWCSLYALESGRYADYTVVDQAVRACGLLERWNAKGYVNALLRGFLRERGSLEARIQADAEARYQHPRWWIEIVRARVSRRRGGGAGGRQLPSADVPAREPRGGPALPPIRSGCWQPASAARTLGDEALLLERPVPVERLPGFDSGEVSVQDAGAQRAAHCLDVADGQRVLDACAAPGGKSGHLLERAQRRAHGARCRRRRAARGSSAIWRASVSARACVNADCTRPGDWWDGVPFDRILADVPCSASGIARRHPDIKWLRRANDVAGLRRAPRRDPRCALAGARPGW